MIVARREPTRDPLSEAAQAAAHALANGLERLEAGGPACGMDADALGGVMIDGHEHRDRHRQLGAGLGGEGRDG